MHGSPYTSPDRPADNGALVHDQALQIEVRLTEAAIAEDFLAALANRYLPERFFYWFPLSVRAWLSLCQDGPYRNYVRSNVWEPARGPRTSIFSPNWLPAAEPLPMSRSMRDRRCWKWPAPALQSAA